ncbi:hypothetical protein Ga0609869_002034 [Rhodovulum iodosum]|uniref:Isocitrate dehydrogenase/Hypothetical protein TT1725 C-terminal domain-containing protein n=1 Tax=Rhodovulum iodosum TaxID=68291 RepID=A0ABV3XTM2_9RHOB|nr:hypothetical protein [Rhodovulum robiginosum]RSK32127.1 hypothetical protein EJA01_12945 [Rhodovulum robiginosum]
MLDQTRLSPATGAIDAENAVRPLVSPVTPRFGGIDLVVDWGGDVETLAHRLRVCAGPCGLRLAAIWKDGQLVWPDAGAPAGAGRAWQCRFTSRAPAAEAEREIPRLLYLVAGTVRWTHAHKLDDAGKAGHAS